MKPLHDRKEGPMRIAALLSGKGSHVKRLIELEREYGEESPYRVIALFGDRPECYAHQLGEEYGIPSHVNDIAQFYKERGKPRKDMVVREEYDRQTLHLLAPHVPHLLLFSGYMSIGTKELYGTYPSINLHPADLRIMENGKPKYTGAASVKDAIISGENEIRASTHLANEDLDGGPLLFVSGAVPVHLPEGFDVNDKKQLDTVVNAHYKQLKSKEWELTRHTVLAMAHGRIAKDDAGALYLDGKRHTEYLF